jgi:hypothetical protein
MSAATFTPSSEWRMRRRMVSENFMGNEYPWEASRLPGFWLRPAISRRVVHHGAPRSSARDGNVKRA